MSELHPQHIVLVRHGESEGDVRRAARKAGNDHPTPINTATEGQTEEGHHQSSLAGKWIVEYILQPYAIKQFDMMLTSPMVRTEQSAVSLGMNGTWVNEQLLSERNRGLIQGLSKQDHASSYPESYRQMIDDPLHWTPPGGESIIDVVSRAVELRRMIQDKSTILLMTHRDWLWAAHVPMEGISEDSLLDIDTELIHNSQVMHYTNVDPYDGTIEDMVWWKRSVCPWQNTSEIGQQSNNWVIVQTGDRLPAT